MQPRDTGAQAGGGASKDEIVSSIRTNDVRFYLGYELKFLSL